MNLKKYLLCVFVVHFIFFNSYGQKIKVVQDFRVIQEIDIIKSFSKRLEINVGTKFILEQNASQAGEFDLDFGLSCKLLKFVSAGIEYRWSQNRNKYNDFIVKNRLSGDIDFIARIKRLKADYRICYQNIDDEYFQNNENAISKNILRNRLHLKYNIRKCPISPFLYVEHYGQLSGEGDYGIKLKSAIGGGYSINKNHELKVYYRIDRELNNNDPYIYSSLGVCYEYNF